MPTSWPATRPPHVDMYDTGRRAGTALMRMLKGEVRPTTAWGNVPMLPHVMRQGTADEPNRSLQARAKAMEAEGALCASLFVGFPHADIRNAGLSVVITTDHDMALAERLRDELLARPGRSAKLPSTSSRRRNSVARAKAMTVSANSGPVFLLDHYDNAASGGPMDTTRILPKIMRQQLDNVAAFGIFDGGGAAMHRCRHRRDADAVHWRQAGDADVPRTERSAGRHWAGQDPLRRKYRAKGPWRPARSRTWGMRWCWTPAGSRSCCSPPCRALQHQHAAVAGHRPDAKALRHAEEPHPLACRMSRLASAVVECAGVGVAPPTTASMISSTCAGRSSRSMRR